ncbi:MAG: division/cell wall cluster transcriptional repressor MraZ [Clostridia bacterium]|nr:division/cell wall cluster transcriptional repressor MraZ [Clostridia bacterium]
MALEEKNEIVLEDASAKEENLEGLSFSGTYTPKIDEKGRFFIPGKFRDILDNEGTCTITHGLDGCLWLYSQPVWKKVFANLSKLSDTKKGDRYLKRFFLGGAKECELDKQGRVLIPPDLRAFANIEGDIQLVGVGNKIEIWAQDSWTGYGEDDDLDAEYIAENLEELEL